MRDTIENKLAETPVLFVNEICIPSAKSLYYACMFPNNPDIQNMILSENDISKIDEITSLHNQYSRNDWESVKIPILNWCLEVAKIQGENNDKQKKVLPLSIPNFLLLGHPISTVYTPEYYLE